MKLDSFSTLAHPHLLWDASVKMKFPLRLSTTPLQCMGSLK